MTEEDLKAILAKYQQKTFELFNTNIVLETQVEQTNKTIGILNDKLEKLKKSKRTIKEDFT